MTASRALISVNMMLPRLTKGKAFHGFTVVELLVTISILSIVTTIVAPSMISMFRGWMISGAAQDFRSTLIYAQSEATRSFGNGSPYTVCASSQSASPSDAQCGGTWDQGAIVFADTNANGARDPGERVIFTMAPTQGNISVSMKSTLPYILFGPNGMLHGNERGIRFTFSHSKIPLQSDVQHLCVLRGSGHAFLVKDADLQTDLRFKTCKDL